MPLLLIALMGFSYVQPDNFTPVNVSDSAAIAACAALTLWAFIGLESATVPAGNVDQPERTIPLATIIGTCLAAIVYIFVTVVAFGVAPIADLQSSSAPLADVARLM